MKKPAPAYKPSRPRNLRRLDRAQRVAPFRPHADSAQGYVVRVAAAAASGGIVRRGTVTEVSILHDYGCRRPYGGRCSCQPEISARDETGRVHVIDANGGVVASHRPN